jgi:hypothetical protein
MICGTATKATTKIWGKVSIGRLSWDLVISLGTMAGLGFVGRVSLCGGFRRRDVGGWKMQ